MTAQIASQPAPPFRLAGRLQALRAWRYEGGKRDLRLDLLRGFAVFAMVIDHIGGENSPFYLLTGGNRFFFSAAEAFVFLSGLLMGMINGGLIRRGDIGEALTRVLRRAGMLYTLTVGLTAVVALLPLLLGLSWAPRLQGESVIDFIVGVLTLHRSTYLVDVMLLYTLLVLAAEPVLLLLKYGYTWLVLAASWGLWLVWQGWPQSADVWPIPGDELFTVAAWQVLFMTALVIGYHRRKLEQAFQAIASPQALLLSGLVLASFIALYAARLAPLTALTGADRATVTEWLFAKDDVAPGRIVAFAAFFVFAYALLTLAWQPLVHGLGWLLLPFGQNALSAYVTHIFVVGLADWLHPVAFRSPETPLTVALYQLAGILIVWATIRFRPLVASSLEHLESAWALVPAVTSGITVLDAEPLALEVRLAQAQARQGVDMLR
ncbi:MAG: OpgC domain-containing protein [Thermomicrobiales bacterium]